MFVMEYLYENKLLNLAPYHHWINDVVGIKLKFCVDNIILDEDFLIILLKMLRFAQMKISYLILMVEL